MTSRQMCRRDEERPHSEHFSICAAHCRADGVDGEILRHSSLDEGSSKS